MSREALEVIGTLGFTCMALKEETEELKAEVETLEAKVKKQRQEIRRLAFYMQLEFVVILFLSIGMGILARAMN